MTLHGSISISTRQHACAAVVPEVAVAAQHTRQASERRKQGPHGPSHNKHLPSFLLLVKAPPFRHHRNPSPLSVLRQSRAPPLSPVQHQRRYKMREVISLNGMFTLCCAPRALTAGQAKQLQHCIILTLNAYSRPGWLPNRQFLLGSE